MFSENIITITKKWDWDLAIAHCDHQWESDEGIADHVEKFALNLQLPFYLKTAENLKETENEARKWRYKSLIEIAKEQNFKYIVTAHTKSDRAETFLYNLIRGAGSDGLRSMNWERELDTDIYLVRPLLEITRSETLQFCELLNLAIWEDVYNHNLKYARNRIRQELIPYLKEHFNLQIEEHLTQTAELLKGDVEYLEIMGKELLERALFREENKINRQVLKNAPIALQRRAIRQY
ncbi:MAG TPA: tRNA lysidine(34) synthetase TilS, partial [Allocoleopsis sp.]